MPFARDFSTQRRPEEFAEVSNTCTLNGREIRGVTELGAEEVHFSEVEPKQVRELISRVLPVALHVMHRRTRLTGLPLHLYYVDPDKSLDENSDALHGFLESIRETRSVWMPVSGNASLILHTLRQVLPLFSRQQIALLGLLYVGESTLQPLLQKLATDSNIDFSFHALY